jgi:molybdopterin-guanine dinucleotide biosynthesis protein A
MADQRLVAHLEATTGVVLAGGQSRRMGRDKALLELSGETLLARAVRLLSAVTTELLVVGRRDLDDAPPGVRIVPDEQPGLGPLGGIATALRTMRTQRALVVACDMPLLQPVLLRHLLSLASHADVVVPRSAQGPEPLHAVYSAGCLPAVDACLRDGERAVSVLLARVRTQYVEPREWAPYDPDALSFLNVNTPDDWLRIVERLST